MKDYILEACVDSYESALNAFKGGANRLELCSNLIIGGTSPSLELFKLIKKEIPIKVNVLIRPRFGDFFYTEKEKEIINNEIKAFKAQGADGVVIGALKKDGTMDEDCIKEFLKSAKGLAVTFHRAFDMCRDPYEALEQAINLGVDTILTSGQANNCILGKNTIKNLIKKANGEVNILVAGGVLDKVIEEIFLYTGAKCFHMSGKIEKDSLMEYRKENIKMGLPFFSEYLKLETDVENIEKAKNILEILDYN